MARAQVPSESLNCSDVGVCQPTRRLTVGAHSSKRHSGRSGAAQVGMSTDEAGRQTKVEGRTFGGGQGR